MSCNISVPIEDIAESVAQMLRQQFIEKDGGTGTGNTLTDTVLRGGLTFDATAKQAICDAIERCVASQIAESQAEQDADIDDKINAGDDRLEDKINGFEDRIDAGRIVGVTREDDTVTVKLANGNEFPFSITDSSSGGDRPVQFAPSSNGDNIEITLADGSVLDMTRQEFADWLASDESPLATDEELQALADDIANNNGDLQSQIDELNDRFNSIDYDQSTLSIVDDKLRVTNEDGTFSETPLVDLIKVSPDVGNEIELRENGVYLGRQAPPNLSELFVDGQNGDDTVSLEDGGGTIEKPFKTLQHALDITPIDKSNTIYLKSVLDDEETEQEYVMTETVSVVGNIVRKITSYGEPIFNSNFVNCVRQNYPYPAINYAMELKRPKIKQEFVMHDIASGSYQYKPRFNLLNGAKIYLPGINWVNSLPTYNSGDRDILSNTMVSGTGTIELYGVVFTDNEDGIGTLYGAISGDSANIIFRGVRFDNIRDSGDALIGLHSATATITASTRKVAPVAELERCLPEGYTGEEIPDNVIEVLQTSGMISGIVRGNSGDPLNVKANFNI